MNINNLSEDDIGKGVIYQCWGVNHIGSITELTLHKEELGFITSFNDSTVWVCFDGTGRGQSCHRDQLLVAGTLELEVI